MPDPPPLGRLLFGPPGKTCRLPNAIGDKCSTRSDPDLGLLSVVVLLSVVSRILPFPIVGPILGLGLALGFPVRSVFLSLKSELSSCFQSSFLVSMVTSCSSL